MKGLFSEINTKFWRDKYLLFILAFCIGTPSLSQAEQTKWTFFTYFATNDKPTQLNRKFADSVRKATDGRLDITVRAGGELPYKAPDVFRVVSSDQVQMGDVAIGFASGDEPALNILGLPLLCTGYDQFENVVKEIGPDIDKLIEDKFKILVLNQWTMPPQNLWLNKPIENLEDIKDLKVRAWNPEQVDMMKALGGSAVSITSAEVIPALDRGIVDGAITSALSANDWQAFNTVKTGYLLNITMAHQVTVVNKKALADLSEEVRNIFLEQVKEWQPRYTAMAKESDQLARDNLEANGVKLVVPTPEDMAKGGQMLRPIWDKWAKKHGDVSQDLLDKVKPICLEN